MSSTRDAGPASAIRSPLDLAVTAAIEGDHETALRHAGAILEEDPTRSVAVLLVGHTLGLLGHIAPATAALRRAVRLGVVEGSLPRAVAAAVELGKLGIDKGDVLRELSQIFARGSKRLLRQGATPPSLVRQRLSGIPLPHTLSGDELIQHVTNLVTLSGDGLDSDDPERPVPRQVLLSSLDPKGLQRTLEVLDLVWVGAGTKVVEQAQPGQEAYILARGEVVVQRKNESGVEITLARLGSGALFGEMALLSRAPRAASVAACRPSLLLVAKKDDLDAVVALEPDVGAVFADYCRRRMMDNLVRTSSILNRVQSAERSTLMQLFVTRSFEPGERLIAQGQQAEGLHLIASGEVAVVHHDGAERTVLATLTVGEVVGEMSLVLRRPSTADVVATAPTVTMHLPHGEFMGIVRRYPEVLSHLYELAVEREAMTSSIVAQEATEADDFVLV
jgi:CRP-like cAMP-binding protein